MFDETTPPRDEAARVKLINAISKASKTDETHWLEWKSTLDLANGEGRFKLAKEILAMANRQTSTAQLSCGGWGFVVIGASEEGVNGVTVIEPASLQQQLAKYLGSGTEAPHWEAHNVDMDGTNVLVVDVAPPQEGDRIHTLKMDYGGAKAGTVYVRVGEKAEQASPAQIRTLEDRLLDGGLENRLMERIALACTTLEARVRFDSDLSILSIGRASALVHGTAEDHQRGPFSIWIHPVARFSTASSPIRGILEAYRRVLRPGYLIRHLVLVFPKGTDLTAAHAEVRSKVTQVFSNPPEEAVGTLIVVCGESFGEVHFAVQYLLEAGPRRHSWATPQVVHLARVSGARFA